MRGRIAGLMLITMILPRMEGCTPNVLEQVDQQPGVVVEEDVETKKPTRKDGAVRVIGGKSVISGEGMIAYEGVEEISTYKEWQGYLENYIGENERDTIADGSYTRDFFKAGKVYIKVQNPGSSSIYHRVQGAEREGSKLLLHQETHIPLVITDDIVTYVLFLWNRGCRGYRRCKGRGNNYIRWCAGSRGVGG